VKVNRHDEQDEGFAAWCALKPDEVAEGEPGHVADGAAAQVPPEAPPTSEVDEEAFAALMLDAVSDGARLCDLHGIPDHVMNGIHVYAYDFYRQGRLDEAEAFFRFLCLYDFHNPDYATGLAAVFQLQERYRQAIDMYGVAMRLSSDDPSPVFYAGQCFLRLGIPEDAAECFEFVIEHGHEASMLERARSYLESIARGGAYPSPPPPAPPRSGPGELDHGEQETLSEAGGKA
jgi:type III secretion system low calcium response chaperone LcrH/SycD